MPPRQAALVVFATLSKGHCASAKSSVYEWARAPLPVQSPQPVLTRLVEDRPQDEGHRLILTAPAVPAASAAT